MRKIERMFIRCIEGCSKIANQIGIYNFLRKRTRNKIIVLMYHGVTAQHNPVSNFDGKHVAKETFEKQLIYLKKHYSIISLKEYMEWKQGKKESLPKNAVVLTFDDGYKNCYTTLYPILKAHNAPATIFLPTAYIRAENEKGSIAWYDVVPFCISITKKEKIKVNGKDYPLHNEKEKIAAILQIKNSTRDLPHQRRRILEEVESQTEVKAKECKKEDFLFISWGECKEMQDNGISFGSHTVTHQVLTMQTREEVYKELKNSKSTIEQKLKEKCTTMAYPFGNNNNEIRKIMHKTGYLVGLTTDYGYNTKETDTMQLHRITVSNKSTLSLFMLTLLFNFPKVHHSMYVFYSKVNKMRKFPLERS